MTNPKGIAALPVLAIIGAVVALAVGWFLYQSTSDLAKKMEGTNTAVNLNVAVNTNTNLNANTSINTNASVNVNTVINTNVVVNTNTAADATKDWKKYTNSAYSFSFRYPATWTVIRDQLASPTARVAAVEDDLLIGVNTTATTVRPGLRLWVNSAFGPPTSSKTYTLARSSAGFTISKEKVTAPVADVALPKYFTVDAFEDGDQASPSFYLTFTSSTAGTTDTEFETTIKQILSTFTFTDPTAGWKTLMNEGRLVRIKYPDKYTLEKKSESNRRGSLASYNIVPQGSSPYLEELQLFSRESIQSFNERCQDTDRLCFDGDYPTVARFDGLYDAFEKGTSYQGYTLMTIGEEKYLVKNISVGGEGGLIREYNAFVGTTMVTIWAYILDNSMNTRADTFIAPWQLEYAGF